MSADPVDRIEARLRRLVDSGDLRALRDPQALADVEEVLSASADGMDLRTANAIATFHWARWDAGVGDPDEEFTLTLAFFRLIYRVEPDQVPEAIRDILLERLSEAHDQALALAARHGEDGDPAALEEAAALLVGILETIPDGDADRPVVLANLAVVVERRFTPGHPAQDTDARVELWRHVLSHLPPDPDAAEAGRYVTALAAALWRRYREQADVDDLDEALAAARHALEILPLGGPARSHALSVAGRALQARFERGGDPADIDEALDLTRTAVELTEPGDAASPGLLSDLAAALQRRYLKTADARDLDEAVETARRAVAVGGPAYLATLGRALITRFERLDRPADLDEAVAVGAQARDRLPEDHPDRPAVLSQLAAARLGNATRLGSVRALDEAIAAIRNAAESLPPGHADRRLQLAALTRSLRERSRRTGGLADLDEAVRIARTAVAESGTGVPFLVELLGDHFTRTGETADLDEAVRLLAGQGPEALADLARYRLLRHRQTGDAADLAGAAEAGREAVRWTPEDAPDRWRALAVLGAALAENGDVDDLDAAIELLRSALDLAPAEHPERPELLGGLGVALGRCGAFDEAIPLLEQVVAGLADGPDRAGYDLVLGTMLSERWLRDAAPGDLDAALARLRAAERDATLGSVRLRAADRWARTAAAADRAEDAAKGFAALVALQPEPEGPPEPVLRDAAAWAVLAGLPERAAELLEYERLLRLGRWEWAPDRRPLRYAELAAAAADGPVVLVNLADAGCAAVLVTAGGALAVPLPGLGPAEAAARAAALRDAAEAADGRPETSAELARFRRTLREVLGWLRVTVAEPVLAALPAGVERLWWCPAEPLALLPLHAATPGPAQHYTAAVTTPRQAGDGPSLAPAGFGDGMDVTPAAVRRAQRGPGA